MIKFNELEVETMKYRITITLTLLLCFLSNSVYLQTEKNRNSSPKKESLSLIESNAKALEIVNRAAKAIGGLEKIKDFKTVSFDYEGEVAATFQGLNPANPHRNLPRIGNLVFDFANKRLFSSSETKWANFTAVSNSLYKDGKTYELDERTKTYNDSETDEILKTWQLRLAPLLIRQLLENQMSLRYEGQQKTDGQLFNAVSSTLKEDKIYRFYFTDGSDRLTMIEHLDYSSDFGDLTVKAVFYDFQTFDGLVMPTTVKLFNNNQPIARFTYKNILFNNSAKLDKISIPENYRPAERTSTTPKMQTREIASDVYLIENLAGRDYNVMFADLGDFLIVFEAPIDIWASKIVLQEIRKVFSQKTIRYVMITHFHDDHAAGIRQYMANGVTVITTKGNKSYFEKVAGLKHTFHTENSLLEVEKPKFEIVRDKFHEINGKNMTVQFLDLGPTPHVDENIIAYIPERNIIFQGDFFRVPFNRNEPEKLRDEGMVFYQKIKDKNLKFTQLVGAHGAIGEMSDLEKAYQLRIQ